MTRKQLWLAAIAFGLGIGATLAATGFHIRIEFAHQQEPVAESSREQIIAALQGGRFKVAMMDNGYRSGGIVGDKRDGNYGNHDALGHERSGGIFESHGATGSWNDSGLSETGRHIRDTWSVDVELGWDRGPKGHVGGSFSHESTHDFGGANSGNDHHGGDHEGR